MTPYLLLELQHLLVLLALPDAELLRVLLQLPHELHPLGLHGLESTQRPVRAQGGGGAVTAPGGRQGQGGPVTAPGGRGGPLPPQGGGGPRYRPRELENLIK